VNIEGTEYNGDQDDVAEPVDRTSMNRRDFLRAVGRISLAGLAHFTIIGVLAKSAEAGCEEEDNCQCGADPGVQDKCTGNETPGQPERDCCNCGGDQGVADHCTCGGVGDSRASDSCYPGDPSSDACTCGDDWSGYDSCACNQDADGSTGSKDNCTCGGDGSGADTCTAEGTPPAPNCHPTPPDVRDYHHDNGNRPADNCTCGSDGQGADICKCWHDQLGGDNCTCSTDTGGVIDNCACCTPTFDTAVADSCECGQDHSGSWCYHCDENPANDAPPRGFPKVADWCNCGDATTTDVCTCSESDSNGEGNGRSNQADSCGNVNDSGDPYSPTPKGDVCACNDDQASDQNATDFCTETDTSTEDACTCTADAYHLADVCAPGAKSDATYDYCCPEQDGYGDVT